MICLIINSLLRGNLICHKGRQFSQENVTEFEIRQECFTHKRYVSAGIIQCLNLELRPLVVSFHVYFFNIKRHIHISFVF